MASKALVLGGGGVAGVAWELGVLAGIAETGVDVTDADLTVGTSAGSVVGSQLMSGVPIEALYEAHPSTRAPSARAGRAQGRAAGPAVRALWTV